jgi:putative transcriptional regulator
MPRRPVSVLELPGYRRRADDLLTASEQEAIVDLIAYEPTCGDVIPGTGGLRKIRVGRGDSGRRGGARVILFLQRGSPCSAVGDLRQEREVRHDRAGQKEIRGTAKGDHGAMVRNATRKTKPRLADDIRASLEEALKYARGEKADVVVHRVVPSQTDAREARHNLGLSQSEFASFIGTGVGTVRKWELGTRRPSGAARALIDVIKAEPKAVRRALAKTQRQAG